MPLESSNRVVVNGISGVDGKYAIAPLTTDDLARGLRQKGVAGAEVTSYHVQRGIQIATRTRAAIAPGMAPDKLADVGWGVIFHRDEDSSVKAALAPLAEHRRKQVGSDDLVRALEYSPGDTIEGWLSRHDVWWGSLEPERVPYYLLIAGAPRRIPFEFVHALDAEYCVGVLDFDEVSDYERYVRSVIAYETGDAVANSREAVFFGTRHPFDDATILSADWLVTPLADGMPARGSRPAKPSLTARYKFGQRKLLGESATRQALTDVLASDGPSPSLLFTATHGMVWPKGHPQQLADQGALLCQDWPGLGTAARGHYFAGSDVPDDARLGGMVAFVFACFGAGTPPRDRFSYQAGSPPEELAERPLLAALPKRLLSHPKGAMLACIGHVERAWGYSIVGQTTEPQLGVFQHALERLLLGQPVGLAVQEFNDKCAVASVSLTNLLTQAYAGQAVDDGQLLTTWAERNDAEGYVVVGDPAVRLRTDKLETP
jgi:hypothetical protein